MANYYMQGGDGKEYGPVSAEQLRQWAVEGRANAQTQVRATDGVGYVAFGTVPELTTAPAHLLGVPNPRPVSASPTAIFSSAQTTQDTEASAQTKRLASVVAAGSVWIKLLALAMFLLSALLCVTIVGLLVFWLPLWQGINLWGAANKANDALYTGSEHDLSMALDKIRRSFAIGFFLIVALGLFYLVIAAVGMMMGGMGALQGLGR
jgi:hypothetical protein